MCLLVVSLSISDGPPLSCLFVLFPFYPSLLFEFVPAPCNMNSRSIWKDRTAPVCNIEKMHTYTSRARNWTTDARLGLYSGTCTSVKKGPSKLLLQNTHGRIICSLFVYANKLDEFIVDAARKSLETLSSQKLKSSERMEFINKKFQFQNPNVHVTECFSTSIFPTAH